MFSHTSNAIIVNTVMTHGNTVFAISANDETSVLSSSSYTVNP